ncbi:unnamed protein product [Rotaria sp. Silwood1]|nr:unnamed protein product [Rotaria sp. Silwood1]CAF1656349.1 unnamed protein product [Rotaria sp. Silwood1]CAF3848230.1 unnamed protein product [Rotaria sp. Silwood1]CAF3873741.1 unnamed protein product [Rotaria sp. Silwood1]CAF3976318.1 unnamed protein product [Rotaria sp. Silwood1]
MLKCVPQYDFKDIQIDDLIIKQEINQNQYEQNSKTLTTINHNSSSSVINEHTELLVHSDQISFIPIDTTETSSISTNSIGYSHHFASQINEIAFEPQSCLTSACSTVLGSDDMVNISFKIPYQHNRHNCLISFNDEENSLLIYSLSSRKVEHLSLNSRQISSINLPFSEPIVRLDYSKKLRSFYCSTRQTNRFILFRLN